MGYCCDGEDRFDVFLRYARADDDAHNGLVSNFERYLKKMVTAELKRDRKADKECGDRFRACRDESGFRPAGDLPDLIDKYVRQSEFLFIF